MRGGSKGQVYYNATPTTNSLAFAKFLELLLSIPLLVTGIWLATRHHVDCLAFLTWPLIAMSAIFLLASFLAIVATIRLGKVLLILASLISLLLLLLLLALIIFAFVVSTNGGAHPIPDTNSTEYRLSDFSPWLRDHLQSDLGWLEMKACILDQKPCASPEYLALESLSDYHSAVLTPLQSGCCKPPSECNYKFKSPSVWTKSGVHPGLGISGLDCGVWNNEPSSLCYDCDSCRAGLAQTVRKDWFKVAKIGLVTLACLVVVHVVAWCLLCSSLSERAFSRASP